MRQPYARCEVRIHDTNGRDPPPHLDRSGRRSVSSHVPAFGPCLVDPCVAEAYPPPSHRGALLADRKGAGLDPVAIVAVTARHNTISSPKQRKLAQCPCHENGSALPNFGACGLSVSVLMLAGLAQAAEYHVATGGSDTASGQSTEPWATLQHGVDALGAGDSLVVHAGTYPIDTKVLIDSKAGTQALPIVIRAEGEVILHDTRADLPEWPGSSTCASRAG